jgi:N-acetylmuramate 1-kinase
MSVTFQQDFDQSALERLAELMAFKLQPGDAVLLHGDLGSGKTTFARALIRALAGDRAMEVPSPTFSLAQIYETPRFTVVHADLYRLASEQETGELGLDDASQQAAVVIEWPERAPHLVFPDRWELSLLPARTPELRRVTLSAHGAATPRLERVAALHAFLDALPAWRTSHVAYMQGDASARAYARLERSGDTAILMDAPRQPDGPPIRDGKSYSRIAHLAEDVRPFVAIANALRRAGLSAPEILAHDLDAGILLVEDLGDRVFGAELARGRPQAELYRAAVDTLLAVRARLPIGQSLPLPGGSTYDLPRFDRAALEIEIDLFLEWYWPAIKQAEAPEDVRRAFHGLWSPVLDRLMAQPPAWFLRDVHAPNLIWLPDRAPPANIGLLDIQDALAEPYAYDLASLLRDARVDVPEALEQTLFRHYCDAVAAREPAFDESTFAPLYNAFSAQRSTRHIGLFVRLVKRDRKPQYLQHIPRAWTYVDRALRHPDLQALATWYDDHFPPAVRRQVISP